ncbi:DMT family transporter [Halomonas sp.]|uniref:DMT family transporter n=1 Tax=Halomonas sp. TaxID=1486246 RepID=UPI003D0DD054
MKKGIICMCLGMLFLALGDATAKWLGEEYPTLMIIFFRTLVGLPLIMMLAYRFGGLQSLRTKRLNIHLLRGIIYTLTMACFVVGISLLPLAEATAIAFVAPVLVAILSVPLLQEPISKPVTASSLVGFLGVLIVVRPSGESFQIGYIVMLGAALFFSLTMITARRWGATESLWSLVFYINLVPFLITGIVTPWLWVTPEGFYWAGFFASGVFGVCATTFITMAFRYAPAAAIAPFDYTSMIWAVIFGWLFWGELPDRWVLLGAFLIIGSGLFIAYYEGKISILRRPEP